MWNLIYICIMSTLFKDVASCCVGQSISKIRTHWVAVLSYCFAIRSLMLTVSSPAVWSRNYRMEYGYVMWLMGHVDQRHPSDTRWINYSSIRSDTCTGSDQGSAFFFFKANYKQSGLMFPWQYLNYALNVWLMVMSFKIVSWLSDNCCVNGKCLIDC